MNKALVYLTVRRTINSLKRIPRTPRLLVPTIFLTLILLLQLLPFFLSLVLPHSRHRQHYSRQSPIPAISVMSPKALTEGGPAGMVLGVEALLLASVFTSLIGALNEGTLSFDASDIDHLFPGPFGRRTVLLFRMLPRYASLLVPAFYVPLVMGGTTIALEAGFSPIRYWPGMLGAWLFLVATVNYSQALLLLRWSNPESESESAERRRARFRTIVGWALALLIGAGVFTFARYLKGDGKADLSPILHIANAPLSTVLLAPLAWAAGLFRVAFEGWTTASAWRMTGTLTLFALSFVALFSRDHDFYDGATELSARVQRTQTARRGGDTSAMLSQMAQDGKLARGLTFPEFGGGARAILWMEMISVTRTPLRGWLQLLVIASLPALFGLAFPRTDLQILFSICFFAMQMSGIFLNGLRQMLRRADLNKTLPIPPMRFLLAALSSSVALLTVLGWFSLTVTALVGSGRGPLLVVAFLIFPSLAALMIAVQTGFVLLYPQPKDVAQNTIGNLLSLLFSIGSLVPGVGTGVLLYTLHLPLAEVGLAVAGINFAAASAALLIDAALWQRYDPTT